MDTPAQAREPCNHGRVISRSRTDVYNRLSFFHFHRGKTNRMKEWLPIVNFTFGGDRDYHVLVQKCRVVRRRFNEACSCKNSPRTGTYEALSRHGSKGCEKSALTLGQTRASGYQICKKLSMRFQTFQASVPVSWVSCNNRSAPAPRRPPMAAPRSRLQKSPQTCHPPRAAQICPTTPLPCTCFRSARPNAPAPGKFAGRSCTASAATFCIRDAPAAPHTHQIAATSSAARRHPP